MVEVLLGFFSLIGLGVVGVALISLFAWRRK